MRQSFLPTSVLLLAVSLISSTAASAAEPWLCLTGSNTIGESLAPRLVDAFARSQGLEEISRHAPQKDETEILYRGAAGERTVVLRFHGTGTGFAELRDARCGIWMASRPAKSEELEAPGMAYLRTPAQEAVIALDGLAIIVHPDNPVGELTRDQVRDIFAGKIRDWSALGGRPGAIRPHARDDASGTFDTFRALVLGDRALHPSALRYESTDELSRMVAVDPRAIGFVGLSGTGRNRALAVRDGRAPAMAPTTFNVATEDYALSRRLFLYIGVEPNAATQAFITFAQGEAAQALVSAVGFVPMTLASRPIVPRNGAPTEYLQLTDAAERLSLSFRFGSGKVLLDARATRDLDRLADYMHDPARAGHEVILVGFAEPAEFMPIVLIGQSIDRADNVARELVQRGVSVRHIRGYGPALPLTAGSGEPARAKNRRVEVWVRPGRS